MRRSDLWSRRGANALEFALALPVLVIILAGVVDYSWYMHMQHAVVSAVSQGARAGAATSPDDGPEVVGIQVVEEAWTLAGLSGYPTVTSTVVGSPPDAMISVTATMPFTPPVGLLPVPAQNQHTTTMRIDVQPQPIPQ